MNVTVITGPPGAGKSTQMLEEMAGATGRYLWAAPIVDLIDEQAPKFRSLTPIARLQALHSKAGLKGTVKEHIEQLGSAFSHGDHVAAFATHEGLLGADFSYLNGWHVRIDEAPNSVSSGRINVRESIEIMKDLYSLLPTDDGRLSRVEPNRNSATWSRLKKDDLTQGLVDFDRHARRPCGVCVNVNDWSEARTRGSFDWMTVWTPLALEGAGSVSLTGAGYYSSIGYLTAEKLFPGQIIYTDVPATNGTRIGQPEVVIHYFTDSHRGTKTFWESSAGRENIVRIERWLRDHNIEIGFWSGNEPVRNSLEHRIPGEMTAPKLAGMNRYRDMRSCLFIYSSKPTGDDNIIADMFNLSEGQIVGAREDEDIIQFAYRGAIRDVSYCGPYDVYLYHKEQALNLQEALSGYGFLNVDLIGHNDAGIMDYQRPMRRRKSQTISDEDRVRNQREKSRIRTRNHRARKNFHKDK